MSGPGADLVPGEAAQRMAALGSALSAAGLRVRVTSTCGALDMTAELRLSRGNPTEVIADEDAYVEVRHWDSPGAGPAEVAAVITRVLLAAITSPPP